MSSRRLCKNCHIRQANTGYSWCQPCYLHQQSTIPTPTQMCNNCHIRQANSGYSWCQTCYLHQQQSNISTQLCRTCQFLPPHARSSWCQSCCQLQQHSRIGNVNTYTHTPAPVVSSNAIYFYHSNQPYYEFTNFYPAPFWVDNVHYQTSEHYYQAQKFRLCSLSGCKAQADAVANQIQASSTARDAFDIAQRNKSLLDMNKLNQQRDQIMHIGVFSKFNQNPKLRSSLLSTGKAKLIENSPIDNYWGIGANGNGQNKLGEILMNVRSQLLVN